MMTSNKYPNQAKTPSPTSQKPKHLTSPSPKSHGSNKATHGSLSSPSAGSGQHREGSGSDTRGASSGYANGQREAWAMQKWLDQGPSDEPWRPGSRKA